MGTTLTSLAEALYPDYRERHLAPNRDFYPDFRWPLRRFFGSSLWVNELRNGPEKRILLDRGEFHSLRTQFPTNKLLIRMFALAVKELVFLSRRLSSQPQFMSSPFVLIDDTNSNIQYSASDPWFEVGKTQNDTGSYGRPFQSTLHGVNFTANFSYPFGGMLESRLLYWF